MLTRRRLGSFHHSCKERCAVLLHCDPGVQAKIGSLLAGWLHWYWHMPLQEAVLSAEMATGCTVDQVQQHSKSDHSCAQGQHANVLLAACSDGVPTHANDRHCSRHAESVMPALYRCTIAGAVGCGH